MNRDLLLEIGTEEIPAKFMPASLSQLESIASTMLNEQRIIYGKVKVLGTPRRLTLIVEEIEEVQADITVESKGPSIKVAYDNGTATKAAIGFARGQGVAVEELVIRDGYIYAVKELRGQAVTNLLPSIMSDIINALSFPKNMRWANLDIKFVRPIRWIVSLFGNEIIPFSIAGVNSGNKTRGHRFLGQEEIIVDNVADYFQKLQENYVMIDQEERRNVIRCQIEELAVQQGGIADIDEELLQEVIYLVEFPTALCGKFDTDFLKLPKEAIITPMREHQRYFPVLSPNGELLPVFITVRNGGSDYLSTVQHGNERVLKARLSDAQFFFIEDRKTPLSQRLDRLKSIVFQEGLGTLFDKTQRIKKLALMIAEAAGLDLDQTIVRAAELSKADLVTSMVYEFTELQGVMGREYALLDGENKDTAQAIYEHYLPRFSGDSLPQSTAGRAVSIADKMDNIVATFSRGLIPTGSQDPYALRRQALGIVNILIDSKYNLSLAQIIDNSISLLEISATAQASLKESIQEFFKLRLKNLMLDENIRYDIVEAIMGTATDDIYDAWLRAKSLSLYAVNSVQIQQLVQAFSRVGNLAKKAAVTAVDPQLFEVDVENELYEKYLAMQKKVDSLSNFRQYDELLATLSEMVSPIDKFFETVMVMVEDARIRDNRLALLHVIHALTVNIADLSKIVL